MTLISSSKPFVRKKAILTMYKVQLNLSIPPLCKPLSMLLVFFKSEEGHYFPKTATIWIPLQRYIPQKLPNTIPIKVLLKFPDALRPAFPRIKEKLDDPDPGVQCAAVNVICELARKNPQVHSSWILAMMYLLQLASIIINFLATWFINYSYTIRNYIKNDTITVLTSNFRQ